MKHIPVLRRVKLKDSVKTADPLGYRRNGGPRIPVLGAPHIIENVKEEYERGLGSAISGSSTG